jgi:hypothetical protein
MLAFDTDLREKVRAEVGFDEKPDLEKGLDQRPDLQALQLSKQPKVTALREIDKLFRARGLCLSAYGLAEINRWLKEGTDGDKFAAALDTLKVTVETSMHTGAVIQSAGFLEAVGALVADPLLRDMFGKNLSSLRENGFAVSPVEEEALRNDFRPGSAADAAADRVRILGWSSDTGCFARALVYEGMFHINA